MGKHSRKKQKLAAKDTQPLGAEDTVGNDADKDDEERRLESKLFGKPFVPSEKNVIVVEDDQDDFFIDEAGGGAAFEQLQDKDLFYVDGADGGSSPELPDFGLNEEPIAEEDSQGEDDGVEEESTDLVEQSDEPVVEATSSTKPQTHKKVAWVDPDDENLQVSLSSNKRLRKLRDAEAEDVVGGTQYEAKLRREFERINPQPEWASDARKKLQSKKRRRSSAEGEDIVDIDDLLTRTDGILDSGKEGVSGKRKALEKEVISIQRLRDANQSAVAEGEIKCLQFHPSPQISVMLTASSDRRLRLFNIDGHTNPHVLTVHVPSLPITNAVFHPNGASVLLTGPRPFYYTVDLQAGTTTRSPRGLWGTSFTSSNPRKDGDHSMEISAFNPSGDVLAVGGRRGYVHLVDWRSGAAQVIGNVKMNSPVKALWWARGQDRHELLTLGEDSEVYLWDVAERRCVRRWTDDGGYGSLTMSGDSRGQYLATGSKTGIVNVYSSDALSPDFEGAPKPQKTLGNLTTAISTLQFNHDSQLLAIASNRKKDQMRLVHLPSLTAYANWPTSNTPLGHVTAIDFSRGSEYIGIGNNRGRVLLYNLSHFVS